MVHIWIVNSDGHVLIQKRSPHVRLMPNVWAVTSGSAISGEDSLTAAKRELREELGFSPPEEAFHFIGRLQRRNSFLDIWMIRSNVKVENLTLQSEEVAEARWVTVHQLQRMIDKRQFHNYGRAYFKQISPYIFKK